VAVGAPNSGSVVEIYRLNETAAASNATGAVNARTLTANGNPDVVTGWIDGARRTGTAKWFERADAGVAFAPASITVYWCGRIRQLPGSEVAVVQRGDGILAGGGNYGWAITLTAAGALLLRIRGNLSTVNTTTTVTLVPTIQIDRKLHVAFTSTGGQDASSAGGTLIVYVDGSRIESTTAARGLTTTTEKVIVGRFDGGSSVDADHEDVAVYSEIKSATDVQIAALNALGRGTAATTSSGTLSTHVTADGHQSSYTEHSVPGFASPRAWRPVAVSDVTNGKRAPAEALGQIASTCAHLRGRQPKVLLSKSYLPASTGVAGPLALAYLRWTTSPTAQYVRVVANVEASTTSSSTLDPRMYVNADTATAVSWAARHTTVASPGVVEARVAVTPGKVTTLSVHVVDSLRVTALRVTEEQREDLDGSALYVPPEACVRGRPITNDVVGGLYRWLHDLYREQRPPLLVWTLDETAAGLGHTTAIGTYVNVLGGETQSVWSWQSSAGGSARGFITYPYYRAYASSGTVYASVMCHFASAVAADTTVRFASAVGVVDVAVSAGQSGWFDGGSSLQLRAAFPRELVQVLMTSGGGLSTLTGLALMPATS
jgi:hypothetical protein